MSSNPIGSRSPEPRLQEEAAPVRGRQGQALFQARRHQGARRDLGSLLRQRRHCREPIVKAIQEMAAKLELLTRLPVRPPQGVRACLAPGSSGPGNLDYAFFSNSGSEAVDTALKIALAYHKARGEGARTRFIGRERGYHGIGFGGISVGGMVATASRFGNMRRASTTCPPLRPLQAGLHEGRAGVGHAPGRGSRAPHRPARRLHDCRRHRGAGCGFHGLPAAAQGLPEAPCARSARSTASC